MTPEMVEWYAQSNARSRAEGVARGIAEGIAESIEKVVKNLFAMGVDDAFVSQATGLDIETVKKLRASMCA